MAMAISMSYVSPAIVAKRKTETRRRWTPEYARRFKKGDILDAYSHAPRYGGVKIATIRLEANPYREKMSINNTEDKFMRLYEAEGFAYMDEPEEGFPLVDLLSKWVALGEELWVVPFEIISVEEGMVDKFCTKAKLKQKRGQLIDALLGEDMRDDLMQPPAQKEDEVQKSVRDVVMQEVAKKAMEQTLPKCDWCGKEAIKTTPFKVDKKRIDNICPDCRKLPDEGRWGEVAGYLGHIKVEDGKKIDEEVRKDERAEMPMREPTKPTPQKAQKPQNKPTEGFWICNGCGNTVEDDMACNVCFYTKEKSMREIEEVRIEKEEEEKLKQIASKVGQDNKKCPKCSGTLVGNQCGDCGALVVLEEELDEGQIVCPECSCVLEEDEDECPECGLERSEMEGGEDDEEED
jgi:hypothetical protein